MNLKKDTETKLMKKANNINSLRIIYKKVNQKPEIKIINNIFTLKKAIVKNQLVIIPYETVYIICCNKNLYPNMKPNIIFNITNILGDFIIVDINKKEREFKSLSQVDIVWYLEDITNKSIKNINNIEFQNKKYDNTRTIPSYERIPNNNNSNEFEKKLINVLVNIELVLATILKNGDSKKNE